MTNQTKLAQLIDEFKKVKKDRKFLESTSRKRVDSLNLAIAILAQVNDIFKEAKIPTFFDLDNLIAGEENYMAESRDIKSK